MTEHIVHRFDDELRQLHEQVMTMARLVEEQARAALSGGGATAGFDDKEQTIDNYELSIDEAAVTLIARRGPMASDLRAVIAFSKMATDLERIGDEAANLNALAAQWSGGDGLLGDFADETEWAAQLLQRAVSVLQTLDAARAEEMEAGQAKLVEPFRSTIARLVALDQQQSTRDAALRALAARSMERIGDHTCNLCEHVVYLARGFDVRHQ